MHIGIIGAGFSGLAAAHYLSKKGHRVSIFEKDTKPGGLAIGFTDPVWEWSLEYHYHHWFTNDKSILDLAQEINHKIIIKRPKTSAFVDGNILQLDSLLSLLKFSRLNILDRIRMGGSLALLRYNPFWKPLEKYLAEPYLKKTMGSKAYKKIWEPLMVNKLGKYSKEVSLAWFWARIYKRTPSLAYPEGGFLNFAKHLEKSVKNNGGKFYYGAEVTKLSSKDNPKISFSTSAKSGSTLSFDSVVVTLPSILFLKIAPGLPKSYIIKRSNLKSIGATNLILRLKKPFLKDGTYWLNMCDENSPILAIVEHTNYMSRKNYNNEYIVYLGNYMDQTDPRFKKSKEELLKLYDPWLNKINPNYQLSLINSQLFKAPFAQPIIPPNYSKMIPKFTTPLKNVYLSNIEQVYPWDRGTNYAVELGQKVAKMIDKKNF